jgi:hypothetical protein
MENDINGRYWDDLKSKLKQKYPMLTNADLLSRQNTKEDILVMIALKLGITNKELQAIITEL